MLKTISVLTVSLATLLLGSGYIYAADGIGFAQAEEGTWYCLGDNPNTALNCARAKCQKEANGQGCYRTRWCFGHGWSGMMTISLAETHSTEIICGAPSRDALIDAFEAYCKGNEYARNCSIFLTIDPDGREQEIHDNNISGPVGN